MPGLIERLRSDHAAIVGALDAAKGTGVASDEGRRRLLSAKARLIAHLQSEDAELYPPLEAASEEDPGLRRTLVLFARDQEVVSSFATGFFDKHGQGSSDPDLARDFGKLCNLLRTRIRKEEDVLYQAYLRVENRNRIHAPFLPVS